jgi:hypothetical protein
LSFIFPQNLSISSLFLVLECKKIFVIGVGVFVKLNHNRMIHFAIHHLARDTHPAGNFGSFIQKVLSYQHVAIVERSLERVFESAERIGPATAEVLKRQAKRRKHPEETLRSAQGILRLARDFTPARLEVACERALALQSYSYRAVRTLIETPAPPAPHPALDLAHDNVRGARVLPVIQPQEIRC